MKIRNKSLFSLIEMMLLIAAIFFTLALSARAQTIQTNPPTFLETVQGYLSSFNPALTNTFAASKRLTLWAGFEQNQGDTSAADLGGEFKLKDFGNNIAVSAEATAKNAGVGGVLLAAQGGANLSYTHVDLKIAGHLDGGYNLKQHTGYASPGISFDKALTDNTFAGVLIELPIQRHWNGIPSVVVRTGFTF